MISLFTIYVYYYLKIQFLTQLLLQITFLYLVYKQKKCIIQIILNNIKLL